MKPEMEGNQLGHEPLLKLLFPTIFTLSFLLHSE